MNILQANYLARRGITMDQYQYQQANEDDMWASAAERSPDIECLGDPDYCKGAVDYHWNGDPDGKTWPRCEWHQAQRVQQRENSIEKYANSDVPPAWFDPSAAGERWDDDY